MEQRREDTNLTNGSILQGDSFYALRPKQNEYVETEEEKTALRRVPRRGDFTDVMSLLHARVDEIRSRRIEIYELELYRAAVIFAESFTSDVTLNSLETLHHIYILQEEQDELTPVQLEELNLEINAVSVDYPSAAREYRLISALAELSSALIVKWNLYDAKMYEYRQSAARMKTPMIDLPVMSEDIFTVETLWLASMVQIPPLSQILDESVRQYAIILQHETCKFFTALCTANEGDKDVLASLESHLALENVDSHQKLYPETRLNYVKLVLPGKFVPFCCWGTHGHTIKRLKAQLLDFDLVFRYFEQALINSLLTTPNNEVA